MALSYFVMELLVFGEVLVFREFTNMKPLRGLCAIPLSKLPPPRHPRKRIDFLKLQAVDMRLLESFRVFSEWSLDRQPTLNKTPPIRSLSVRKW